MVCLNCCNKEDAEKQQGKAKVRDAFRSLKNLPANKELVQAKQSNTELDRWFAMVATFIKANPHCWNCGEFIPDMTTKDGKLVPTDRFYRAASAHIFPKSLFQSVATHPLNFLILGAGCGCHHEFDSSIDKACEMKVWPTSVLRFIKFEENITETHKYLDLFKSKLVHRNGG